MNIPEKLLIVDFDGVITSQVETPGSFITHGADEYGASPSCFKRLIDLARSENAKIVISSNWRKFDNDGPLSYWHNPYGAVKNPLPKFREQLGDLYLCDLPKIRHLPKAHVLILWFEEHDISPKTHKFVIFDDDPREQYRETPDYGISSHVVMTDKGYGLSDKDVEAARKILST